MLTYQDLVNVGEQDENKMDFVRKAIAEHKSSEFYKTAKDADLYCKHKNVTIERYQKLLYTMSGKAVPDNWSANFKMASRFFYRFVTQENQFLLGNGVSWKNESTKDKLGKKYFSFDSQLQKLGKSALVQGVAFGFFNLDHIDVFDFLEFVPLYDEEDGSMKAGIRYWQIDSKKPLRATLYEIDGYTDYVWNKNKNDEENGSVLKEKRPYKLKFKETNAEGIEIYDSENYPGFPIVPLWGNSHHQSEIVGLREQIDCYDLIKSGFANTVDEASIVYWTLTNAGGMDDVDLAKFVERMKTVHATRIDDPVQAESHTIDAPYESREALLKRLEEDLYKDAMALNTSEIASGNISVTATQIKAAYEPLNAKADDFEYCVGEFINRILDLAGIEDEYSFTRSYIVNKTEEISSILQSANYLDSEYVTKKILTILGDGDQAEKIIKDMESDDISRFNTDEETEAE